MSGCRQCFAPSPCAGDTSSTDANQHKSQSTHRLDGLLWNRRWHCQRILADIYFDDGTCAGRSRGAPVVLRTHATTRQPFDMDLAVCTSKLELGKVGGAFVTTSAVDDAKANLYFTRLRGVPSCRVQGMHAVRRRTCVVQENNKGCFAAHNCRCKSMKAGCCVGRCLSTKELLSLPIRIGDAV